MKKSIKMKKVFFKIMIVMYAFAMISCNNAKETEKRCDQKSDNFQYNIEQFADFKVFRYQIPDFESLDLNTKILLYYLYEASHAGRDIFYDQNYRYNLMIRKTLEQIIMNYAGDKNEDDYQKFLTYAKCVFASNGIHHMHSSDKFIPEFSKNYFKELIVNSPEAQFPIESFESLADFTDYIIPIIFDPEIDSKKIVSNPDKDIIKLSASNYYHKNLTFDMVRDFYDKIIDRTDKTPISYGLNSKLMLDENGKVYEEVWKTDGMYGEAIKKMVYWLKKAIPYTENDEQKKALQKVVEFYKTGDLRVFDEYSIAWVNDTESFVDFVTGFIEIYDDPVGRRGAFQAMLSVRDAESSKRTGIISNNAQWFEDNLPIHEAYKRKNAVGVDAKAINVVTVSGDNAPAPPIGVNLPNSNWIRAQHGSKSVTITNIFDAHRAAATTSGALEEFSYTDQEVQWAKEYGTIGGNIHIDMHEIIGHGSGQLKPGVGDPASTLKNYYSPLEEARADLVALYFMMDPHVVELGLMPSLNVAKSQYDGYIRNGMLTQLVRIQPGANIEQAHMRARKLISEWSYEKGKADNVIEKIIEEGKTYYVVNDYQKLRKIFGDLLKEVQRIKSEGDYNAGRNLVENYAVKVDPEIHQEVLARWEKLNIAPYTVFINPVLVPIYDDNGNIVDVKVEYPKDFLEQMIYYGEKYSNLPIIN